MKVEVEIDTEFVKLIKKQYGYSDGEFEAKVSKYISESIEYMAGLGSRFEMWLDEEEV